MNERKRTEADKVFHLNANVASWFRDDVRADSLSSGGIP